MMRIRNWLKWGLLFTGSSVAALQMGSCIAKWIIQLALLNNSVK